MFPGGDFKGFKNKLGNEKLSRLSNEQRFGRAGYAVPQGESGMEGEAVAAQTAGFFPLVVVYIGNTGDGAAVGDDNQPGCASCKCRACAGAKHACGDTGDVYTIGDANTHKHAHGDPNTDAHGDGDINSIADAHSDANTHSILDPNAHTDAHTDAHPYLYTHRISHGNIHAYINTDGNLEIWRGYTHFLTIPQDDDCH